MPGNDYSQKLGRRYSPDARDHQHLLKAELPTTPYTGVKRWWDSGAWLDQGYTGTCVGHGWAHWVEDAPKTPEGTIDPFGIYRDACLIDEWTDNDDQNLDWGTSVRAGAKVLQGRGIVTSYSWAFDLQTVINAVGRKGPVVVGTTWYDSMFSAVSIRYPDGYYRKTIRITAGSEAVGGHCYVLNGVDTGNQFFRMKNSWGRSWAANGRAYIGFKDMEQLILDAGEACMAVQV